MRRIQLGDPYEEFIAKMIASGYYSTATEVIRDALRMKMKEQEENRLAKIRALLMEGQASAERGDVVVVDDAYMDELMERAKQGLENDKAIPDHVKP